MATITSIVAVSCKKDNTILYNNQTMGNIVDGRFISDQGNLFNIVEQNCPGQLDTMDRALILCDVLNRTENGKSNEYDVRLNYIVKVLAKDAVAKGDATEEMLVEDPIHVEYIWTSGGYLNMYIVFPYVPESKKAHYINLIHEGEIDGSEKPSYRFTIKHNSYGDKISEENKGEIVLGGGYVSFPLNTIIKEESAEIKIDWLWHKVSGSTILPDTEYKTLTGTYTKTGYQHTPSNPTTRATAEII